MVTNCVTYVRSACGWHGKHVADPQGRLCCDFAEAADLRGQVTAVGIKIVATDAGQLDGLHAFAASTLPRLSLAPLADLARRSGKPRRQQGRAGDAPGSHQQSARTPRGPEEA